MTFVKDYAKEFNFLILDIKDMLEVSKLFNFMFGLQGWAWMELRRQSVQDLPATMIVVDCLVDYKLNSCYNPKGK